MGPGLLPPGSGRAASSAGPVARLTGSATGLVIPAISRHVPRLIHQPGHNRETVQAAIAAGIIKPTDKFTTTERDYDADQVVMDMVMERLFDKPDFDWFDMFTPLRISEVEPGEFCCSTFCGASGEHIRLDPLFTLLRGKSKRFKLEGETPLHIRWVAWLLNTHSGMGHPHHMWDFWMDEWYNPGKYDEQGDDWHELEDAEEKKAIAEAKVRWAAFKKNYPFFFFEPENPPKSKLVDILKDKPKKRTMEDNTDEALSAIKRIDPKLAEILHSLFTYRKETKNFSVGEPLYLPYWEVGTDLEQCLKFIGYNLHQGNMEVNDPFFDATFKMENAVEVTTDLRNFLGPLSTFHRYTWRLCRKSN